MKSFLQYKKNFLLDYYCCTQRTLIEIEKKCVKKKRNIYKQYWNILKWCFRVEVKKFISNSGYV